VAGRPWARPPIAAPGFDDDEERNARLLIEMALAEDLGGQGDLTGRATIPAEASGRAAFVARAAGVLGGLPVAWMLARRMGPALVLEPAEGIEDGSTLVAGQAFAVVSGPMRDILAFERTALNFLQRLSGVATQTARFVREADGTRARILDTRKTTPGWRVLEKYAVRCGGGTNHRMGLFDGVLIKDNHLAYLADGGDPIGRAVGAARAAVPPGTPIEVEVDSLEQLDRALELAPQIVLLDNFGLEALREAVRRRDARSPGVRLEASGGVNLETVRAIAETGVDRISVGALTHSAPALDIALDYRPRGGAGP
jgi:nicotinate-nucleotide pyrophosphorylase (carboxylating)